MSLPTRRDGCNDWPRNGAAGGRPLAAGADRTRRFSFVQTPKAARRARPGRPATAFRPGCWGGQPQPEAQARHKRASRPKAWANNCRGAATAASWNATYFACVTAFAPILSGCSRGVVSARP